MVILRSKQTWRILSHCKHSILGSDYACFGMFDRYKIDTFQAVVVNYLTCIVCGVVLDGGIPKYLFNGGCSLVAVCALSWSAFYRVICDDRINSTKQGAAIASVSMKLGLIFPSCWPIFYITRTLRFKSG